MDSSAAETFQAYSLIGLAKEITDERGDIGEGGDIVH